MMTIEERVAALERALASMDRAWAMMEKRTSDMICAAIEDRCGDAARRRDDRLAALEREDSARKGLEHELEERIAALERDVPLPAPCPQCSLPMNAGHVHQRATAPLPTKTIVVGPPSPVHMLGGQDDRGLRLSQIESELSALAARRGTLVGERERLRGAP